MKINTFFAAFEHHLLVAEPKRSEIIRELRQHGEQQLGNPKRLAQEYNRTHIGFFYSPKRVFFVSLVFNCIFGTAAVADRKVDIGDPMRMVWSTIIGILVLAAVVTTIVVSQTAAKTGRATLFFSRMLMATLAGIAIADSIFVFFSIPMILGVLFLIPLSVIFLVTQMFVLPMENSTRRHELLLRFLFEIFISGVIAFLGYYLIRFWTELTFVPYDVVFIDQRPAAETAARIINDFFEGGIGAVVFAYIGITVFSLWTIRRVVQYGKHWQSLVE